MMRRKGEGKGLLSLPILAVATAFQAFPVIIESLMQPLLRSSALLSPDESAFTVSHQSEIYEHGICSLGFKCRLCNLLSLIFWENNSFLPEPLFFHL